MGSEYNNHIFTLENIHYLKKIQVWCVIQFKPLPDRNTSNEIWLLGNTLLRKYDSVYDITNRRIGLIGNAITTSTQLKRPQ